MKASIHSFDTEALSEYLEKEVEGFQGPLTAEKFADGQSNPTFLLKSKSGNYVLRRKPPGQLLQSAHAVDREYRVLKALQNSAVPVARALHLCDDDNIIGSMFYVMSFEGGSIHWDPSLPQFNSQQRNDLYREMIRVMAAIHSLDIEAADLADYGRPGNYFERQINRWSKQYKASETERIEDMETLMQWLADNMPADDGQVSLIHGDYRLDNIIFHEGQQSIRAVLDWELSTLGHPLADLAYLCMGLRLPKDGVTTGLGGADRVALGIPSEDEMIALYCQHRGIERIANWNFYMAFSFFRLAAIAQGVLKRALDGNASNENALRVGRGVALLAQLAIPLTRSEN